MADPKSTDQSTEDVVAQLRYLQSIYSQQYELTQNNITTYSLSNTSLQRNIDLLEKAKSVENSNILISGEGGAYVLAKTGKVDKAITYIGGGYLAEKTVDQALSLLKENHKKGEEILNGLISDKTKLEKELLDIQIKMNELYKQASSSEG